MDLTDRRNPFNNFVFPPPPPPSTTFTSPIFPRTSSTGTNFPILAIAVIGILATAFLLVSYYIFVIKCCLNWHQIDIFRRRRRSSDQNPLMIYSPHEVNKGLDESAIRAIPIFKFKKRNVVAGEEDQDKSSQECSVCLNEFQEDEKLRIIPNCCHVFHIDCIDIWLQGNANCPLCRTSVSCDASFPLDLISAPSSSPENSSPSRNRNLEHGMVLGGDDDFVVIELGASNGNNRESVRDRDFRTEQERVALDEVLTGHIAKLINPSPRNIDHRAMHRKERKFHKVMSMGDECINTRGKDMQFGEIQPIRRSISMDSSADRQLYLAVQEAMNRRKEQIPVARDGGGCTEDSSSSGPSGNNRVMKRCFFSFGSSRTSKSSSILPVYLEP
ncbi:PREDICTED: RING-H2 finger protein ATL1-like [Camelina sativa]|uniref:RING-type E3 ubiquitin transferase n=1 Tax=Camelina sativa TaxID=90675 RepID=A0ABM0WRE6_CAMSA|nr:PREDICTED: RING-H2 finger protein ATL1-like [Camelina sativa]